MGFFDSSAGGIVGGAASLVGSAIASRNSLKAQREVNEMNYKIWGEQRQHNIDMFNMQNQANIDMWNMQNAYNDPSAQIERLSSAGLNPYLAMGNNPSGVATNAPATGTMNPSNPPTMQAPPPEAFDIGLGHAVDRIMQGLDLKSRIGLNKKQGDKLASETNEINTLLPWKISDFDAGIISKKAQAKMFDAETSIKNWAIKKEEATFEDYVSQQRSITATLDAESQLRSLQVQEQQVIVQYIGVEKALNVQKQALEIANSSMDLQHKLALIDKLYSDIEVNKATIREKNAHANLLDSQKTGQDTANDRAAGDLEIFNHAKAQLKDQAIAEAVASTHEAHARKWNARNESDYSSDRYDARKRNPAFRYVDNIARSFGEWSSSIPGVGFLFK